MEEVAARAGVGKATVYRRWPSRGALALDAFMAEFRSQLPVPDTGTLRGDLLAALRSWSRAVTSSRAGRMLAGLIAEAQRDPQLAVAWRERVFEPLRTRHRALVERAVRRGEIASGTDADVVLDLVFGAAYHRLLQGHLPLNDRFARQVVNLVMDGLTPGPSGPGSSGTGSSGTGSSGTGSSGTGSSGTGSSGPGRSRTGRSGTGSGPAPAAPLPGRGS